MLGAGITTVVVRETRSARVHHAALRPTPRGGDVGGTEITAADAVDRLVTVPIQYGNIARSYLVQRPATVSGDVPLVVLLHGSGSTGEAEVERTGFGKLATRAGFELVVPQSIGLTWNSGNGCCSYEAQQKIDDIGFIRAVVADAQRRTSVDGNRIYLVGYSNGGKLAYGVACTKQRTFAGLATYGAGPQLPCAGAAPLSLFAGYGTADPLEPPTGMPTNERGQHQPLSTTVTQFLARNHCPTRTPVKVEIETATLETYAGCDSGTAVRTAIWQGLDHRFPSPPAVAEAAAGATLIWDFLSHKVI